MSDEPHFGIRLSELKRLESSAEGCQKWRLRNLRWQAVPHLQAHKRRASIPPYYVSESYVWIRLKSPPICYRCGDRCAIVLSAIVGQTIWLNDWKYRTGISHNTNWSRVIT